MEPAGVGLKQHPEAGQIAVAVARLFVIPDAVRSLRYIMQPLHRYHSPTHIPHAM